MESPCYTSNESRMSRILSALTMPLLVIGEYYGDVATTEFLGEEHGREKSIELSPPAQYSPTFEQPPCSWCKYITHRPGGAMNAPTTFPPSFPPQRLSFQGPYPDTRAFSLLCSLLKASKALGRPPFLLVHHGKNACVPLSQHPLAVKI
jgi:hypothetical protein